MKKVLSKIQMVDLVLLIPIVVAIVYRFVRL